MPHRYFTTDISGGTAVLSGADAHHLAHVMRARPGETVTLCDGKGHGLCLRGARLWPRYGRAGNRLSSSASVSEPGVRVTLYVGYPKQDKLETIVQKAVELGAVRIVPFFSRYCVAAPKKEEQKNLRGNRIAFEAATERTGRGAAGGTSGNIQTDACGRSGRATTRRFFATRRAGEPPYLAGWAAPRPSASSPAARRLFPEEAAAAQAGCSHRAAHPALAETACRWRRSLR